VLLAEPASKLTVRLLLPAYAWGGLRSARRSVWQRLAQRSEGRSQPPPDARPDNSGTIRSGPWPCPEKGADRRPEPEGAAKGVRGDARLDYRAGAAEHPAEPTSGAGHGGGLAQCESSLSQVPNFDQVGTREIKPTSVDAAA
jgi:hypothetical protein